MRARVLHYLDRNSPAGTARRPNMDPVIGCRTILEPVFLPPDLWVNRPKDWAPNIVSGKVYDLEVGEGRRIWQECLDRVRWLETQSPAGEVKESFTDRYGSEMIFRPRLGQGAFRIAVLDAYGRSCAVTTEHSLPVLEAAHIHPYAKGGQHGVSNGLLLRADLHRLYDRGYIAVNPDFEVEVSPALREEWENGKVYYEMSGRRIHVPNDPRDQPDRDLLAWHREELFQAG